jgi:hypothetical protein
MTDSPARRLIGPMRIVAAVLFVLFIGVYILADRVPWVARAAELGERAIVLGLVALFGYVLLAFVLQFFSDLIRSEDDNVGQRLLVLRRPRGVGAIVLPLLTAWLVFGLGSLAFLPEDTLSDLNLQNPFADMSLEFAAMTALFAGIGLFLIVAFTTRALRNRPWFLLGSLGFVYRPGDVSAGVVRWSDIADIKTGEVLASQGRAGPTLKPALIVVLKHPERYAQRYTLLLGLLVRALTKVLSVQTEGGDLYLDPSDFGADYEKVLALMRERVGLVRVED